MSVYPNLDVVCYNQFLEFCTSYHIISTLVLPLFEDELSIRMETQIAGGYEGKSGGGGGLVLILNRIVTNSNFHLPKTGVWRKKKNPNLYWSPVNLGKTLKV